MSSARRAHRCTSRLCSGAGTQNSGRHVHYSSGCGGRGSMNCGFCSGGSLGSSTVEVQAPWCHFVKPQRPASRRGSHKMTPEKPKRTLWVLHGLDPRPQFHEKTLQEGKKSQNVSGERKSVKFWASHPSGPLPVGPTSLFGAELFQGLGTLSLRPPTLSSLTQSPVGLHSLIFSCQNRTWPKSKLAQVELASVDLGQRRTWPK